MMTKKKDNYRMPIDQMESMNGKYSDYDHKYQSNKRNGIHNSHANIINIECNSNTNASNNNLKKKQSQHCHDNEDQETIKLKYLRKTDNNSGAVHTSRAEIKGVVSSNQRKLSPVQPTKPKTLHDWIEQCNDMSKHPRPLEMTKPPTKPSPAALTASVDMRTAFYQSMPAISTNYIAPTAIASTRVAALGDLYPFSKGEIHKISEEKSEIDLPPPPPFGHNASHSATIINCPLSNTYGARLLTKMGWRFGEGLGRGRAGIVRPVRFQTKVDRLGLASASEKHIQAAARTKRSEQQSAAAADKNPVSILMEFCQKGKLSPPTYTDVEEIGPTNKRQFRISVTILNKTYLSPDLYKTKKEARAGSASLAAKELNLL